MASSRNIHEEYERGRCVRFQLDGPVIARRDGWGNWREVVPGAA